MLCWLHVVQNVSPFGMITATAERHQSASVVSAPSGLPTAAIQSRRMADARVEPSVGCGGNLCQRPEYGPGVRRAVRATRAGQDVAMEVPLQVLLGKLDSLDAYGTSRYYDLLNCGFRLPLSVGSDYPANLMGFARVYVYCRDGLDYSKWVDNLAAGRTFVSR